MPEIATESIIEAVGSDPDLLPEERETSFRFTDRNDRVRVYTENAAIARRLLQHPEFDLATLRVSDDERFGAVVDPVDFSGGRVTGVQGTIPMGCLTVKKSPRSTGGKADVVTASVLRGSP